MKYKIRQRFMEKMRHRALIVTSVLVIGFSGKVYSAADTFIDFDATLGVDDNVTRAEYDSDIENDVFVSFGASLGHELWQGPSSRLTANADVTVNQFNDFDGLSNYTAGARAVYTYGFSSGFGAPWMSVDLGYTFVEFDSFLRDSDVYTTALTFGKRIDDRTDLRTAFEYKKRESDGSTFDTEDVSWYLNIDWTIQEKMTLYTTYKIQDGDVFSAADPSRIGLGIINAATAIENDDVFIGKTSYRLDGTTQIFTIGLNLARDLVSAYDISARYLEVDADANVVYEGLTVRISYFHRMGLFE